MGDFKDVCDFLRDAKGVIKEIKSKSDDIKGYSIAKKSSEATLQFPIIVSRSINVDSASNVVKALERQYAIFVQMVISLNPVLNLDEHKDIGSFIKTIHQNNPVPTDIIESCMNVYTDEEYNLRMITSINNGCSGRVLRSNKEQMFCIEEHLNNNKLNDLYKPEQITMERAYASLDYFLLSEAGGVTNNDIDNIPDDDPNANIRLRKLSAKHDIADDDATAAQKQAEFNYKIEKDEADREYQAAQDAISNAMKQAEFAHKQEMDRIDNEFKRDDANYKRAKDAADRAYQIEKDRIERNRKDIEFQYKVASDKFDREFKKHQFDYDKERNKQKDAIEKTKLKMEIDKANAEYRSRAVVKLADNDIKKCNELVPTTLSITLQQIKGDSFGGNLNFVLGIKGLMHPVNSEEMVSNLLDGYKAGNKFFNFLRWTSGEIKFLKDLLLNIDGIKEDVIRKHSKGSHWWTTLKRNRTIARMKNVYGKNRILPNASIVCSMEEIMEIKDTYNVDLLDPRHMAKLMDRYFLLGFVVVDESQELCYFMFDGEREYQVLSFKGLEKENNNKNDFKDIYKMINSGRL